jgi:hypothetical protein
MVCNFSLCVACKKYAYWIPQCSEKPSGSTSLTIHPYNGDDTILAKSCGNTLESLTFRVDDNGQGTFTVGSNTFDIRSESQDGVSCTRIFDNRIATVECFNVTMEIPETATVSADDCFKDDDAKLSFHALKTRNVKIVRESSIAPTEDDSHGTTPANPFRLHARQFICTKSNDVRLVGDGNPHQNQYHRQMSVSKHCHQH